MARCFTKTWGVLFAVVLMLPCMVRGDVQADLPPGPAIEFRAGGDNAAELSCDEYTIPVKLSPGGLFTYQVVGTLCREGALENKTLQMLISGSAYGPIYWDFPCQADMYSYVRAAVQEGYATFNLSRIGIGESDRPFGFLVTVDTNAYVIHQVIEYLGEGGGAGPALESVVTVGHSLGSVIAMAHAIQFPQDTDGVILTGFVHNVNPEFVDTIRSSTYPAAFDPRFFGKIGDLTYMTSTPGARGELFYHMDQADPGVITIDELTKETTTIGEIITNTDYYGEESLEIQAPVLIVIGDEDFIGCGGELDCHDHDAVTVNEQPYFSPAACIETSIIEDTGHNINLHRTAPLSYGIMLDWAGRRVGAGADVLPAEPCSAGF